jgi:phosphoribosyl 1,2-cyclic phosphodiesterase
MSLAALEARLAEIHPKRLVLTHMSEDMLSRRGEVSHQSAEDGMVLVI